MSGKFLSVKSSSLFKSAVIALAALFFLAPQTLYAAEGAAEAGPDLTMRMTTLVIQFGLILFAARVGGWIFERIGMPGVLGELCTGIVIGPSLLGKLPLPGFDQGLFFLAKSVQCGTTPVSPELYGICTFASVVLLFLVGIETDLKVLFRYALAGGLVGLGGVVVSFVVGDFIGMKMLPMITGGSYGFMDPACIFLGVMSTATSVSITARILSEKKKMDSAEGVTTIAAAVIDDVLGIVVLAIAMGLVDSKTGGGQINWGEIGLIALRSIGIWLGATAVGLLCAHYISRFLKVFEDKAQIATMALGLAMVISGLFEEAGLAMIIGAYVLGLSLSRTDICEVIREHLQPIYRFMVPVFFVVMGMMVDLTALKSRSVLIFGAVYTVGAIFAKLVGCGLPTFLCKFNGRGALRVGLGMIPRGEVALIVAGVGLSKGLITPEIFGVSIMMTLITTVLPPPLLVSAFKSPKSGLRKGADQAAATPEVTYNFPTPEVTFLLGNYLMESFREEGFFVHVFNIKDGIYQVRKDAMAINIIRSKQSITFKCSPEEIPFVRTAMTEVVVRMEQTMKALQHPLDADKLLATPESNEERRIARNSRMRHYLSVANMIPSLEAETKTDAIAELVNHLAKNGVIKDREAAMTAILEREDTMSTGLRHGLACPHARTTEVKDLVSVIALVPNGIDFDSLDGTPTKVIQLVLSPKDSAAPYMEFMASMSGVYRDNGVETLLKCRTAESMYKELCDRLA